MAMTQPKKPVGGAFGSFASEKRPEFAKACVGQKASAVAKMAGEAWAKLSSEERAPYQKQYEEAKAKFGKDMENFLAAGGVQEKGSRAQKSEKRKLKADKKAKKDENAPKRPAGGGYGVYMNEKREEIKNSLPKDHKITDVAKKAGELWKALSEQEKKPYETKFQEKQTEYKAAMEEYLKTKPAAVVSDNKEDVTPTKKRARAQDSPPASKSARGPKSAGAKKLAKVEAAPISEDLADALKQAADLGLDNALKNVAARPDVASRGFPAVKVLAALKDTQGLVNKAKAALLSD